MKDYYSGFRFNSQFPFCSFPFVLDTYSGCNHHCTYCFSYFNSLVNKSMQKSDFGSEEDCKVIDVKKFKRTFSNPITKQGKVLSGAIKKKIPIHWGGITDPFSHFERKYKASLEIAKFLAEIKYPYIVSTKGSIILEDEYKKAIGRGLNIIQISLISTDKSLNEIELNSSVQDRLDAIEYYASIGKKVVVRCQPFIPRYGEKYFETLIKEISKRGAKAVTVEYLKLTQFLTPQVKKAYNLLSKGLGYNVVSYYKLKGTSTGSDLEIKPEDKAKVLYDLREITHGHGLEFYCADNAFRFIGDSPICCGLTGDEKGFEGYRTCTTSVALFKAKEKEYITWEDVDDADDPILNCPYSIGFLNQQDVKASAERKDWKHRDLLLYIWNTPSHPTNPTRFFENLMVAGKDKNGNLYYKWIDRFKK